MATSEIDMRFDRFAQSTHDVLTRAQEASARFGQNYINNNHLFLGIVAGSEGDPAIRVLNGLGVDVDKARTAVELLMAHQVHTMDVVGLTERAKQTIELAGKIADSSHSHLITSEHILLGLVRSEGGIARVLESLGVSIDKTLAEAEKLEAERMVEEFRRKIEAEDYQKAAPLVRGLIELHHPGWSPDSVGELTPRATHAIVDFLDEVLDLPEDPNLHKTLFQQVLDRFHSRFFPTPDTE